MEQLLASSVGRNLQKVADADRRKRPKAEQHALMSSFIVIVS